MTEENTIHISPEVHAANNAARAEFFEERTLVASQRYMDAMANLKRVNNENEELRASIVLMSQPRPQDEENNALADLLRAFLVGGVFDGSAVENLVRDAKSVIPSDDDGGADEGEGS